MDYKLYNGDCLIESDNIESGSVDLILTDLPYGTMNGIDKNYAGYGRKDGDGHSWDVVIDIDKFYKTASRILRKNGKIILFAQQPFTTELINKSIPNIPHSYNMIWEKNDFANALLCNKAPVSYYEDILVFSKNSEAIPPHDFEGIHPLRPYFGKVMDYIGLNLRQINSKLGHRRAEHTFYINSSQYSLCTEPTYDELIKTFKIENLIDFKEFAELKAIDAEFKKSKEEERLEYLRKHNEKYPSTFNLWEGNKYKSNILKYKKDYDGYHPTQKPVLLLEDLVKTFSNEGDLVGDLTMGSGSTGVACLNTNRNFIGIELDKKYFEIARERMNHERVHSV